MLKNGKIILNSYLSVAHNNFFYITFKYRINMFYFLVY